MVLICTKEKKEVISSLICKYGYITITNIIIEKRLLYKTEGVKVD